MGHESSPAAGPTSLGVESSDQVLGEVTHAVNSFREMAAVTA
jgi:hypothetical protein